MVSAFSGWCRVGSAMGKAVLLRHDLPDGSVHYDWMVEREPGGPLITFRIGERIDQAAARFAAQRLADHRLDYLEYEGPVSGDRGRVSRVARGQIEVTRDDPDAFECVGRLGDVRGRFVGRRAGEAWEFRFAP